MIVGSPAVESQSMMYCHLHSIFAAIDDGGMAKKPDLLPVLTYYLPREFGVFGDPKQLGPTIIATREEIHSEDSLPYLFSPA